MPRSPPQPPGRYKVVGRNTKYVYAPEDCGLFPRMYSSENSGSRPHQDYYRFWSGTDANEKTGKPSGIENMRFLIRYQCGWMYFRYFMWNFAGRQNNIQGLGYNRDGSRDLLHGNWISGIKFLDKMRLGPQDNLPSYLANNQGRNTFFMLPLLLGLCGVIYQCRKFRHSGFVVFLLFFMTGLAIVLYLNQPSTEPRERDYAFAGSFYAFAIWIGLGIMALTDWLGRKFNPKAVFPAVAVLSLVFVPGLMAQQGWDDHNRSHRTAAYDFGKNSLLSCEANGILIANGDNDTFPVWYCQEVEGIRPDIRIINSALANSFWHIQPLFRKVYDADPLRFTLPYEAYGQGNDFVYLGDIDLGDYIELSQVLSFAASKDPATKQKMMDGSLVSVLPVNKVKLSLNSQELLNKGLITETQVASTPDAIRYELKASQRDMVFRADLAFLDIFASNGFERPVHVSSQTAQSNVLPVPDYAQAEGTVYRIVPYRNPNRQAVGGNGINTDKSYDLFVNQFRWGNLQDPKTAVDPESAGYAGTIRYQYSQLAKALTFENKPDSAIQVLDKCVEFFPDNKVPYDGLMIYIMEEYFRAGAMDKGLDLAIRLEEIHNERLDYMARFPARFARTVQYERNECLAVFYEMTKCLSPYRYKPEVDELVNNLMQILAPYGI